MVQLPKCVAPRLSAVAPGRGGDQIEILLILRILTDSALFSPRVVELVRYSVLFLIRAWRYYNSPTSCSIPPLYPVNAAIIWPSTSPGSTALVTGPR